MAANLLKMKQAEQAEKEQQSVEQEQEKKGTKPKMEVKKFETGNNSRYTHRKIDLQASGQFGKSPALQSFLSVAIKELPSNTMQLKVFFPPGYGDAITVRVPNVCTAETVIRAALKKYSEAGRSPALTYVMPKGASRPSVQVGASLHLTNLQR